MIDRSDNARRFELTRKYNGNFTVPVRDKNKDYDHDELFITELIYSINDLYFENCELKEKVTNLETLNENNRKLLDRLNAIPFHKPELVMNPLLINEQDKTKEIKENLKKAIEETLNKF